MLAENCGLSKSDTQPTLLSVKLLQFGRRTCFCIRRCSKLLVATAIFQGDKIINLTPIVLQARLWTYRPSRMSTIHVYRIDCQLGHRIVNQCSDKNYVDSPSRSREQYRLSIVLCLCQSDHQQITNIGRDPTMLTLHPLLQAL